MQDASQPPHDDLPLLVLGFRLVFFGYILFIFSIGLSFGIATPKDLSCAAGMSEPALMCTNNLILIYTVIVYPLMRIVRHLVRHRSQSVRRKVLLIFSPALLTIPVLVTALMLAL